MCITEVNAGPVISAGSVYYRPGAYLQKFVERVTRNLCAGIFGRGYWRSGDYFRIYGTRMRKIRGVMAVKGKDVSGIEKVIDKGLAKQSLSFWLPHFFILDNEELSKFMC